MIRKVTKNNKIQIHHNNNEKWQHFEDEAWQHLSHAKKNKQELRPVLSDLNLLEKFAQKNLVRLVKTLVG
jgi:hypothetical protein